MKLRPATLAALLFASIALLLAGCGSDDTDNTTSGAAPAATTPAATEADSGDGDSEAEKEKEAEEAKASGGKDCDSAGVDATADKELPSDVPALADAHFYDHKGPFGKTEQYFAAVDGDAEELAEKRDDAVDALVTAGYKKLGTDQEEGTEAEAHLSGPHTVDIQVITLCAGKLRVRYTVS